jgi:kumamolisin
VAARRRAQRPESVAGIVVAVLSTEASIVVNFASNTDAGVLDAVSTGRARKPDPNRDQHQLGPSQDSWTAQARTAIDQAVPARPS